MTKEEYDEICQKILKELSTRSEFFEASSDQMQGILTGISLATEIMEKKIKK